jgi:hypothetical protein
VNYAELVRKTGKRKGAVTNIDRLQEEEGKTGGLETSTGGWKQVRS